MSRHFLASTLLTITAVLGAADPVTLTVQTNQGKAISPDLFGIFFEDLSYAADGGLYAELVQNRSFEYSLADKGPRPKKNDPQTWHALTAWTLIQRGGGSGAVAVRTDVPLNAANPHYAVLTITKPGDGVGLANDGFDGVTVKAGATYDVSIFARQLAGNAGTITAQIENADGAVLASTTLAAPTTTWKKFAATLTPTADSTNAKLIVLGSATGDIALDMVSLLPQSTFKNHPNGLRADLAETIADLHPKFMRFPGGCVAHGDGVNNIYRWKDTIGPVETRKGQPNIWRYHQSAGLGYFEYFQFCEDIGASPLPVLAAGVSCQNSNGKSGTGQEAIPMTDMPAYVQDVLDLIEYANGPVDSTWGAKRAAAGHPAPFKLRYLGIGNEDHITPAFRERFTMLNAAVKTKHPEITVIGTVGPDCAGKDFDAGWAVARELHVDLVDEHYYKAPQWFLDNLTRYDSYPRNQTNVYLGEYAAHDNKRRSTLRAALAEAAYLTHLERNGDVARLASYAPLMAKYGHISWAPNLLYFDNTRIVKTVSYHVQRMFSMNSGATWLPTTASDPTLKPTELAVSAVKDPTTGDLIIKLVNNTAVIRPVRIAFTDFIPAQTTAQLTVLTDNNLDRENTDHSPAMLIPTVSAIPVGSVTNYEVPGQSLSVLRFAGTH